MEDSQGFKQEEGTGKIGGLGCMLGKEQYGGKKKKLFWWKQMWGKNPGSPEIQDRAELHSFQESGFGLGDLLCL